MTKSSTNANNDLDRNPPTISEVRNTPIIGNLFNDDGDENENGKKAIGLIGKTTTLHVHHAFLYIFLPSLHDYDVKVSSFTFCGGRKHRTTFFF